jgi:DNA-binding MarR family transcriptional regulator
MRHSCVYLTPKGRALKELLIPLAEELNSTGIRGIPPEDLAVFRRTAIAMTKNLAQDAVDLRRRMPPLRKVV